MDSKIRQLPDNIANQIAAGEVVSRPASVVKEMVENSIDAGARSVTVVFRDGGRELLQISDDGEGMSPEDARMAFSKHATSKIATAEDIYRLSTFGFRGEALPSIAAVSNVTLQTRTDDMEIGVELTVQGNTVISSEPAVCPRGACFTVRNLFYNVPARRRQLERSTTESRYIVSEFLRIALCHPEVGMRLCNGDTAVFDMKPDTLRRRVIDAVGRHVADSLVEISTSTSIVTIGGFIGTPASAHKTSSEQYMFVNGRYFRSAYLHKAVMQAYEKLVPQGSQPSYFIYISVNPERLDVNIHPQKVEVRFEDGPSIWQILNAAVRNSLVKTGSVPMMDFVQSPVDIPVLDPARRASGHVSEPSPTANPDYNPFDRIPAGRRSKADLSDFSPYGRSGQPISDNPDFDIVPSALETAGGASVAQESRLVWEEEPVPAQGELGLEIPARDGYIQLPGGYVAAVCDGALALIDVSRVRETLMYARYEQMLLKGTPASQKLLFPERVVFSNDDVRIVGEHYDELVRLGFDLEIPDSNSVDVTAIPSEMRIGELQAVLYDLIDSFRDETFDADTARLRCAAGILARHSGQSRVSEAEMEDIVAAVSQPDGPVRTYDGRIAVERIPMAEIRLRFDK